MSSIRNDKPLFRSSWLSDNEINEFLKLLRTAFPSIHGLEDPIILTHSPETVPKSIENVRIMMSYNNSHWVCVRGIGRNRVDLYDSLSRNELDSGLKVNIRNLLPTNNYAFLYFEVNVRHVQQQRKDRCGYFACAFAAALCEGLNPENLLFDEEDLVKEFKLSLSNNCYKMFSYKEIQRYPRGLNLITEFK